ncbi:MAG: phosphoribosylaminoimidazolesuccinocarboxamide synthase [Spirochaetes bacterium]|nr:phosphoribosylaminoimidazolesuccinocarboxamide synthase [Spirochaetota bacterium]
MSLTKIDLPKLKKLYEGKVRQIYDMGEHLMLVATDRLSAFDVIFNEGIPDKGKILTRISNHWFNHVGVPHHLITTDVTDFPPECKPYADILRDRAVIVKKAKRIDFECIVRGYLIGSGWKEYQEKGSVSGISLPSGLMLADKLPEPLFTPSTKAPDGEHDINVTMDYVKNNIGTEMASMLAKLSIGVYLKVAHAMAPKGVILADTKFEFGVYNDEIILIDEVCTPDSSRFWDAKTYTPGENPQSYDKQIVRDYLETTGWNKEPPPPALPAAIIDRTRARYVEMLTLVTGKGV